MNPDDNEYGPFRDATAAFEAFDRFLNESHSTIMVFGLPFDPARVLKSCSETSYRSMFNDWLNGERYA